MEHEHAMESVRCLRCGAAYAKPTGRGSLAAHAGCPDCTYVGWRPSTERLAPERSVTTLLMPSSPHARFGAGPLRLPPPRSG
jgi:hypothetical protein